MRRVLRGVLLCLTALAVVGFATSSVTSAAVGTTFTVDTNDGTTDGVCGGASDCSFGDAITAANANPGKDTIAFSIPGAGPHVIVLPTLAAGPFPTVTDAVVIDGETQSSYAGTPLVEVDVSGRGFFGLLIQGASTAGTEIRGLAIYGGTGGSDNAIDFDNPGGNIVERNFIGTDAGGTVAKGGGGVEFRRGSGGDGLVSSDNRIADNVISAGDAVLFVEASDNQVLGNLIGTDPTGKVARSTGTGVGIGLIAGSSRNLISQNVIAGTQFGIVIRGSTGLPSSDNRIEGNRIGTDIDGEVDLGNRDAGIDISGNAPDNIIGGAEPAARNLISGNDGSGVSLRGNGNTVVRGNLIGTDRTGAVDLGNNGPGITFAQTVGLTLIADNVVSGNDSAGISGGAPSGSVRIEGNVIGTNEQGTGTISNAGDGIMITGNLADSVVGGASEAQRNIISGNLGDGVSVGGPDLQVLNNYIGTDVTGEIDLGNVGDGVDVFDRTILGRPGAGNLISGNGGAGVRPSTCCSGDLVIQANLIGTDRTGQTDLGNDGSGVFFGSSRNLRIGGSVIGEGNVISGNGGWGVEILVNQGDNVIEGNRIGTDIDGADAIPNDQGGLTIAAPFLGRTNRIVDNLISGNEGDGIRVQGGPHHILGNLIGTDVNGGSGLGNAGDGVDITPSGAGSNVVGGMGAGEGNVISGNRDYGLLVASNGNQILANRIGTDVDGGEKIANGQSGIRLGITAELNTVTANVVSGNGADGIEIAGSQNPLFGNLIGTGADGASPLGNTRHGVSIEGSGSSTQNTVGGADASNRNAISFNGGHGVFIRRAHQNLVQGNEIVSNGGDGVAVVGVPPFGATQNTISMNSIASNDRLGIDLQDDGVTPNDLGDGDGGSGSAGLANFLQNTPVNLQVSTDGTTVTGTLNSRPNTTYRVELFGNSGATACDPSGSGEGERFLQAGQVTTDGSGNAGFSVPLSEALPGGDVVTATATDLGGASPGNTSEFSQCADVPDVGRIIVEKATLPGGDPQMFAFTASYDSDGFSLSDGQSDDSGLIAIGVYSVAEGSLEGWDSAAVCSDGSPPSAIQLAAEETVTCTFTNTKRGSVTLLKTTNGVVDPSKDISFVLTGSGLPAGGVTRSTFGDQDGLLEWVNLVPSEYTMCETPVPAGFTSFWTLDGNIVTPYNPDANQTPPEDLGTRCYDFQVSPGQTRAFEVDNSHPGGDPRTIGYWKNWNRCTSGNQAATADKNGGAAAGFFLVEDLLPQLVGDFSVTSCQQAVKLLSKQDQNGRNKASDAAYELGAQLLAAKFNLAAGAETCLEVQQAVLDGQTLLDGIGFTGSSDYLGSKSKGARRSQALSLAATLDGYNNGNLC